MTSALTEAGAGVVASASLAFGALSGKYAARGTGGRIAGELDDPQWAVALAAGEALVELGRRVAAAPATLAYAFALAGPVGRQRALRRDLGRPARRERRRSRPPRTHGRGRPRGVEGGGPLDDEGDRDFIARGAPGITALAFPRRPARPRGRAATGLPVLVHEGSAHALVL